MSGGHVSSCSLGKLEDIDLALHVSNDDIEPVDCVRDLEVLLDNELSMKRHIG